VTGDCLDTSAGVSPGDTELCSTTGVDDDCDGTADEENASGCTNYFYDYDGDGYGTSTSRCLCSSSGYYTAARIGDCNDTNSTVNPSARNCGLMGAVSVSSAATVLTGRSVFGYNYSDYNSIASLDYNRDGIPDVVVGNPGESGVYEYSGAVYMWLGGLSGSHAATPLGDADLRFTSEALHRSVGAYVTAADIDADGYDEIAIGSASGSESYVLDDGLSGIGTVTPLTSGVTTYLQSREIQLLDDLDMDGYVDGTIGSAMAYGSPTGLHVAPSDTVSYLQEYWSQETPGRIAVKSTGDINGDGASDLVVVSRHTDVDVYAGGSDWDVASDFHLSLGTYAHINGVRVVGDMNSDGYYDVAIVDTTIDGPMDPYTGYADRLAGRTYVFAGGSAGHSVALMSPTAHAATGLADSVWQTYGIEWEQALGIAVAAAGDVDGDGAEDMLITSAGWVEYATSTTLWYGPLDFSGAAHRASDADATFSKPAFGVANAGDTNGDGYDDIWVGHDNVYLFHGTPR
jgi:hypothetical protein